MDAQMLGVQGCTGAVDDDGFYSKHVMIGSVRIASRLVSKDDYDDDEDKATYFYHSDHLGSTGYVSDHNGKLAEHIAYFPFGETWIEQQRDEMCMDARMSRAQGCAGATVDDLSPEKWRFTGKELDSETGLYYFGARYYDPRTSLWISADPILDQYLDGKPNDGVYKSLVLGLYSYGHHNPVMLVDPDGNDVAVPVYFRMSRGSDISSYRGNYSVVGFKTYNYSTPQDYQNAKSGGSLSAPIGSFEVSFDAFSSKMAQPERGKALGDEAKWAEMNDISAWKTKHSISITDIGDKNKDTLTVTKGGKNTSIINMRIHSGGPFGSEGCATCVDAQHLRKKGRSDFVDLIKEQLPSLKSKGKDKEGTYIQLPSRSWWPYYNNQDKED